MISKMAKKRRSRTRFSPPARTLLNHLPEKVKDANECRLESRHWDYLSAGLNLLCLEHFGYETGLSAKVIVSGGVTLWVDYCCTEWWARGWTSEQKKALANYAPPDLNADELFFGLLVVSLSDDPSAPALAAVPKMKSGSEFDYRGEDYDFGLTTIYKSILELASGKPIRGLKTQRTKLARDGSRRCQHLLTLLKAVENGATVGESMLHASCETFKRGEDRTFYSEDPIGWVCLEESIIVNIARSQGNQIHLTPELNELLLTWESLT